jgi:phage terminase large subunit-like protein
LIKDWEADDGSKVTIRRGKSTDNKHIPLDWLHTLEKMYKGTRLYRQEVLGEVIEDIEGALWKASDLERSRVAGPPSAVASICDRIVVGVDPPTGNGTCGIVVVGQDGNGHIYVLDDRSVDESSPHVWAARVRSAADTYDAVIVAEINQGGQMVKEVLNAAEHDLPIHTVNATKNKKTRAEPIALLWEVSEQIVHLVGNHAKLEDELCEWVPIESPKSPDRLDALVWACWYLRSRHTAVVRGSMVHTGGPVALPSALSSVRMGRI